MVTVGMVKQRSRKLCAPRLPLALVASRQRAGAILIALTASAALLTQAFLTTLTLQRLLGFSPWLAGVAFLPLNASVITGSRIASRVIAAIGIRATLIMGLILGAVGLALHTQLGLVAHPYFVVIVPGMSIAGIGQGIMFTSIFIVGSAGIPHEQQGVASSLITNATWIGASLGLAVLVAAQHTGATVLEGLSNAYLTAAVTAGISALLALTLLYPQVCGRWPQHLCYAGNMQDRPDPTVPGRPAASCIYAVGLCDGLMDDDVAPVLDWAHDHLIPGEMMVISPPSRPSRSRLCGAHPELAAVLPHGGGPCRAVPPLPVWGTAGRHAGGTTRAH